MRRRRSVSVSPVFLLTELSSFLPTTAKIAFSMNLNASANDSKSYKAQESASGTGSIGWGPFKVSVHVAATGAERGSSTRKSDQRTKADCEVQMARVNPPEGVNRLNDLLTDLGDLAKTIVKAQARDAAQAAAVAAGLTVGPPAPAPAPGG